MKKFVQIFLVFCCAIMNAQLGLNLTGTPENCPSQGALSWQPTGVTSGSTINYTITRPNTSGFNPVLTSATSLSGLVAGTYKVVATETVTGTTTTVNTAENSFTIVNNYTPFSYSVVVSPEKCVNDGFINFAITGGKAPYSYKISKGGTLVRQMSYSVLAFSEIGLSQGIYRAEITDACGTTLIKDINVIKRDNWLTHITNLDAVSIDDATVPCGTSRYSLSFLSAVGTYPNQFLNSPINATITYTNPNTGATETKTHTFAANTMTTSYVDKTVTQFYAPFDLPYFDVPVTASVTLSDNCGVSYTDSDVVFSPNIFDIAYEIKNVNCGKKFVTLWGKFSHGSMKITEVLKDGVPFDLSTSNFSLNQNITGSVNLGSAASPLPAGTYKITGTDACGKTDVTTVTIVQDNSLIVPSYRSRTSCINGFSNVQWYYTPTNGVYPSTFTSMTIVSAPASYTGPTTFTPTVADNGSIMMPNLPDGTYTFHVNNSCGQSFNFNPITITQNDKVQNYNVTLTERCGTFDINIADQMSSNIETTYYLMIYDEATGNWVNPANPSIIYQNGIASYYQYRNQSYKLLKGDNLNLQFKGKMRVMRSFRTDIATEDMICHTVLKEFTIKGDLAFGAAFAYYCADNKYDVIITATSSSMPLTYKIVAKNGQAFSIDNGTNNVFENLDPGVYDFTVTDNCGNKILRRLDVTTLNAPKIRPQQLCDGQAGSLTVDGLSNMNFQWYKAGAPGNILSNTNTLSFPSFNMATDGGTYYVQITSNSATSGSCVNTTLSFVIDSATTNATAGADKNYVICYPDSALNLFNYIDSAASTFGTFTAITPTTDLTGNTFFANNAPAGIYKFLYTVNGCAGTSTATITIDTHETVAPVITGCPTDIYVANDDMLGAIATFTMPNATDNCSVKSIVSTIPSGSTFLPGTTQVKISATDPSGNVAVCTFNVKVQQPLVAINETFTFNGGSATVGNVLTNDLFQNAVPNLDLVTLTPGTASPSGSLVPVLGSNGYIQIPVGTPAGTYTIPYTICDKNDALNCASAVATVVVQSAVCNKPATLTGPLSAGPQTGITNLNKFRSANWPANMNGGFLAVDGINKGLVITRNANPATNIANPVNGMIVWDTTNNCLSMYTTAKGWHCVKQDCND